MNILNCLNLSINRETDIVFGSRLLNKTPKGSWLLHIGRISITWVANILFKSNLTDAYTCYKLLSIDFVRDLNITANGFELEAEITATMNENSDLTLSAVGDLDRDYITTGTNSKIESSAGVELSSYDMPQLTIGGSYTVKVKGIPVLRFAHTP